jgi:hypothetical protein
MPAKGRKGNGGKGKGHAPAGKGALAEKGKGGAARKGNVGVAGSVPTERDAEMDVFLSSPANPPPAPKHRHSTWPDSSSPALRRSGNTFSAVEASDAKAAGVPASAPSHGSSHRASRVLSFDDAAATVGQTASSAGDMPMLCVCACMHVYTCIYTYIYTCMYMHTCMHVHACTCTLLCVCACMYI